MLAFLKDRGTKPLKEEKQILDGLKIVLDNGWILNTQEILKYFEALEIKERLKVKEENLKFMEFVYVLCRFLGVNITMIEDYFGL
mmetsp:Transcript_23985/g.36822  ORF Transcript_23985/g.36822 Transcript_23985/m.36822 type:complete len:85 (+) Transcript_23985:3057-3311(+)